MFYKKYLIVNTLSFEISANVNFCKINVGPPKPIIKYFTFFIIKLFKCVVLLKFIPVLCSKLISGQLIRLYH